MECKMKAVDTSLRQYFFPNINEDGWKFVSIMAFFSIILALIWLPLGVISFLLTIWCFYCFRDPLRVTPVLSGAVIAPADGLVLSINKEKGPDSLGLQNKNFTRVCIFTGVFDSPIERIPIKSTVRKVFYDCGKNFSGSHNKNDIGNETMSFALKHSEGYDFAIRQTATFCSHRIINKLKVGEEYNAGQKLGFIRFGGYVDLFLPEKVEPQICIGQKMIAGETIVADIKSDAPRIEGEIRE